MKSARMSFLAPTTPEWILDGHLLNQIDSSLRNARLALLWFRFSCPVAAVEVSMPSQ